MVSKHSTTYSLRNTFQRTFLVYLLYENVSLAEHKPVDILDTIMKYKQLYLNNKTLTKTN